VFGSAHIFMSPFKSLLMRLFSCKRHTCYGPLAGTAAAWLVVIYRPGGFWTFRLVPKCSNGRCSGGRRSGGGVVAAAATLTQYLRSEHREMAMILWLVMIKVMGGRKWTYGGTLKAGMMAKAWRTLGGGDPYSSATTGTWGAPRPGLQIDCDFQLTCNNASSRQICIVYIIVSAFSHSF
jgi:hypothetical protein